LSVASAAATPSIRLRRKLALAVGPLASACTALVEHPRLAELWPEYLVVQHQIIRATVPLTQAALARARDREDDPVAPGLAEYLDEHVGEELGHDDDLLADLEALGLGRDEVLARMPSPTVAALVGSQYYWIDHHHPIAFLGYVALMEGYPPTAELMETLEARTRLPSDGFRTFAEHGELDPGHRDHLDETLDSLPLTREHEAAMAVSAASAASLAARAVEEVLSRR